jgi:hypothetical protein
MSTRAAFRCVVAGLVITGSVMSYSDWRRQDTVRQRALHSFVPVARQGADAIQQAQNALQVYETPATMSNPPGSPSSNTAQACAASPDEVGCPNGPAW